MPYRWTAIGDVDGLGYRWTGESQSGRSAARARSLMASARWIGEGEDLRIAKMRG